MITYNCFVRSKCKRKAVSVSPSLAIISSLLLLVFPHNLRVHLLHVMVLLNPQIKLCRVAEYLLKITAKGFYVFHMVLNDL